MESKVKHTYRVDMVVTVFVEADSFTDANKKAKEHVSRGEFAAAVPDYAVMKPAKMDFVDFIEEETPNCNSKKRKC